MANELQKKISAAINKKRRAKEPDNAIEWLPILNESPYAKLIPSLMNLDINKNQYENATPEKLQQLFMHIIEILKKNYFNQESNRSKLAVYLKQAHDQILDINDQNTSQVISDFVENNETAASLLFINSQMALAIKFSKLLISVIGRQIKDAIGFSPNQIDGDNIIKLINELTEICPEPKEATIEWFQEELKNYHNQMTETKKPNEQFLSDFSEPLLDIANEDETESKEDVLNRELAKELTAINPSYSAPLIELYEKSKPIQAFLSKRISQSSIRKAYRQMYNMITIHFNLNEPHLSNQLHQFIVQVIEQAIIKETSNNSYTTTQINKHCNRERKEQKSILTLCQLIKKHRGLMRAVIEQLKQMPISPEIEIAKGFLTKKIQSGVYAKIKKIINKIIKDKRYRSRKSFLMNLIQYIKIILTQPVYESSILTKIILMNGSVINLFATESLLEFKNNVSKLNNSSISKSVKRECSYLSHTLTFDEELDSQFQKIHTLYYANFSDISNYLFKPFSNQELCAVASTVNETTLASEQLKELFKANDFSDITLELLKYQEYLRSLGMLRLEAIQNPDDNNFNARIEETYKNINISYAKLYVIIDLIAITSMLPEYLMSGEIVSLVENIKPHLDDMNEYFVNLSNIAHEFGYNSVDPKDIFLLRITRGDFFYAKDHDILASASIAMLFNISPIALFNGIIEKFDNYDKEQQQECLYFVENYIENDSLQTLFSAIHPVKNEFYAKLIHFMDIANQAGLSTNRLLTLISNCIEAKKKRFNNRISELDQGSFSKEQLIQRILTINDKLTKNNFHLTKLDEYIFEITHIMNAKNFINFTTVEQSQLLSTFNQLKEHCNVMPYYSKAFDKLKKNLNLILQKKSTAVLKNEFHADKSFDLKLSFVEAIRNTVEDASNQAFYDKMVDKFITTIESDFAKLFTQIDVSELRDLNWTLDEQRNLEGLNSHSPNIKLYNHNTEMAINYVAFLILYHMDNNQTPQQHHDLKQVKQYYQFIEKALVRSLELKALTTAYIIFKAIQTKGIKRLRLESSSAQEKYITYLSKSKDAQMTLSKIMREDNVLPLLPFIQQKLVFAYKKAYGSQFERLGSIGRILKYFNSKKENIKRTIYPDESLALGMPYFLQKLNLLSLDGKNLDKIKASRLLLQTSNDLKPDITKKYSLSDFKSLNELVKYLKLCQMRLINYHFSMQNPENAIYEWLLSITKIDSKFTQFTDSIETLFLLHEIDQAHKRPYKRFHTHLIAILTLYHRKIAKALKSEQDDDKSNLDLFFTQFNKMKRIRDIKESEENAFDVFSHLQNVKHLIKKIDEQYTFYIGMQEQFEKIRSQAAYSQLLDDVLSGNAKKSLTLPTESSVRRQSTSHTLLPDNEYDIPSAEPEHPDRIGINRTMSFTPNEQSSVLELFKTDELKAEFLAAFPWAVQIDNLSKLNQATFDPEANLLGTPKLFSFPLQLAAMKFVLICLDSLGKIAGFTGELTIQNFDRISEIINQLKWLTSQLKAPESNDEKLLTEVEAVMQELAFRNQEYFDMQQLYNPPFMVENNPNMNGFCHLNEHLVYELTATKYEDSLLAPAIPSGPYLEKISQVVIPHEKT